MTPSNNQKIVFIKDGCIFRDHKEYEERISLMNPPIVLYKDIELSIPLALNISVPYFNYTIFHLRMIWWDVFLLISISQRWFDKILHLWVIWLDNLTLTCTTSWGLQFIIVFVCSGLLASNHDFNLCNLFEKNGKSWNHFLCEKRRKIIGHAFTWLLCINTNGCLIAGSPSLLGFSTSIIFTF